MDIEYERRITGDLSERLTLKKNTYLTYEVVMGPTGLTTYLGSKKSNKFVRIYDKLMERCAHGMAEKALPVFDHPLDSDVLSWFRIEYQVRKSIVISFFMDVMIEAKVYLSTFLITTVLQIGEKRLNVSIPSWIGLVFPNCAK